MLIAKAERKGRKKEEVYEITEWLTSYSEDDIDMALSSEMSYGDFFLNADEFEKLLEGKAPSPQRIGTVGEFCGGARVSIYLP